MPTPRRRSSRLQGQPAAIEPGSRPQASKLSSLLERDESPRVSSSIDAIIDAPIRAMSPNVTIRASTPSRLFGATRTPQTDRHLSVPFTGEMHPNRVHQSTAKKHNAGLSLGFTDPTDVIETPTKRPSAFRVVTSTSKIRTKEADTFSSPTFDFSFNRTDTDLSAEAQRIMESVREDAAKIKLRMQEEKEEQRLRDEEADVLFGSGGRKIATAKGRSGRFSDVHKKEFRKMDSIANHASTWKSKIGTANPGLKRSPSKAGLDDDSRPGTANSSSSKKTPTRFGFLGSERLENSAPAKRMKANTSDDTSSLRPTSSHSQTASKIARPAGVPSFMLTPTKASLARAASLKKPATASKLPALSKSNSMMTLSSPVRPLPKEGGIVNSKSISNLPRFPSIKSILLQPKPKYSDDPMKIAEGTHLPRPVSSSSSDMPATPRASEFPRSPTKRVVFTPTTKALATLGAAASPSPAKPFSLLPQRRATGIVPSTITYPTLPALPFQDETLSSNAFSPKDTDFTFRSPTTLPFPSVPTNIPTSPRRIIQPTIRQVRPSGVVTPLNPFENMPTVPHGIINKKRRRTDDEDDEFGKGLQQENVAPDDAVRAEEEEGPSRKKVKSGTSGGFMSARATEAKAQSMHKSPVKKTAATQNGKVKRGILSLHRLNALARPKNRN
ncbi:hypothetical protein MMC25_006909 [Agyrium rufum]|nr:hypothetical protein [Agyrium rufum]